MEDFRQICEFGLINPWCLPQIQSYILCRDQHRSGERICADVRLSFSCLPVDQERHLSLPRSWVHALDDPYRRNSNRLDSTLRFLSVLCTNSRRHVSIASSVESTFRDDSRHVSYDPSVRRLARLSMRLLAQTLHPRTKPSGRVSDGPFDFAQWRNRESVSVVERNNQRWSRRRDAPSVR